LTKEIINESKEISLFKYHLFIPHYSGEKNLLIIILPRIIARKKIFSYVLTKSFTAFSKHFTALFSHTSIDLKIEIFVKLQAFKNYKNYIKLKRASMI